MSLNNKKSASSKADVATSSSKPAQKEVPRFPVAAIGASAGGLEAIKSFLENVPGDTDISFVIVQHLSPHYKSILPKLLEKETKMPVHQVQDGMAIKKNQVYVIPPGTYMNIIDGHLTLVPRESRQGIFLPIDFFFKNLAHIYKNKAIGILLSGTGTDGTQGFKDIKAEGGITFAQDSSAAFTGMPRSAVDSGFVDFILPVQKIATELTDLLHHPYTSLDETEVETTDEKELRRILVILLNKKGIDFSLYKQTTVNRRILRRMALSHQKKLNEYAQMLRENEKEVEQLYQDLLINVTDFFRDPSLFLALRKKVLPQLCKERTAGEPIRVWISGCATGEEAYSFAITIYEYISENALSIPFQIFATDLNPLAIERARSGIYHPGSLENVSQPLLMKYFTPIEGSYQVIKSIRDACVFATHNMLTDPPFSRMDMVSCQNVMIYFESNLQQKVLKTFHYALKPDGFLLLGKSETIGTATDLFAHPDKELKVYTKKDGAGHFGLDFSFPASRTYHPPHTETNILNKEKATELDIEKLSDNILLAQYVPPSVVVNADLMIQRFHGATSRYLQPAHGKASLSLLKMLREDLVLELRSLIYKARKEKVIVEKKGIRVYTDNQPEIVDLEVIPLHITSTEPYFLILFKSAFEKTPDFKEDGKLTEGEKSMESERIALLEHELRGFKEQVNTMSEEFEATREELQSANEEVLSSNEELQSINEELETSKEELQSTNEELTTINEELQIRNTELKEAFEYREAIVETIREPLIVLTTDLRVNSANKAFYNHFRQELTETEGFFIYEMMQGKWNIPELKEQLLDIISKDKSFENFEVQHHFPEIGGKVLLFSALRMRYNKNKQDRILLVIEDITKRRQAEQKLVESVKLNTAILNSISDIFISVDNKWNMTFINSKGETFAGKAANEIVGKNLWEVLINFMDTEFHKNLVSAMKNKEFTQFEYFEQRENEWYQFRLYPANETFSIYGSRITEQKRAQQLLEEAKKQYESFVAQASEGIWRFDLREPVSIGEPVEKQMELMFENCIVAESNDSMAKIYGYKKGKDLEGKKLKEVVQRNPQNVQTLRNFIQFGYKISDAESTYTVGDHTSYFLNNLVGTINDKKVISVWGTQQDITGRKMIEETLLKTRERLNFALAAGSVGTYVWDFKTNKIHWTKVQESLYGLKEYSFNGSLEDWVAFIHPDDVTATRKAIEESLKTQKELSIEFRIYWPDRSLHWILSRASTTYDSEGKPIEMMGVNIDISERKLKEQMIHENEERFKALVQNSFDVITVFNYDGTITYQSDSIERVLGYSAKDRLGQNLFTNSLVHPDCHETERKLFDKCIENPYQYIQGELRMLHKDGSYRIMEVGCINLLRNSSIHGIIKNYRDITERRAIEKQKEEFIGVASHELKTPVTSIKAYAQILHDTLMEKNDPVSADLLLRMDHQIDRLTSLIKDLLDVTKITEGQLILKKQQFDLNELVKEVTEDLQMTTKKHTIVKELGELKPITGDKERTAQVLVNLLSNAIKYSPSASKIIITTAGTEEEITVCVQDFGIGISKEMQKKLFKRFFRVSDESTSTFPGLGLGLFIATEIVRKQKGRIWVESAPNKGSTFCFSLPYNLD